ncbi:MAG: Gfo/Idh/MocA family oxidoreductase [Eubacteriales bacterium]|nr:Gfo/Idh/MocA family oxidoreductase [Eubacteriales bacterium]
MKIVLVGPGGMGTVHYMNYAHIMDAEVAAVVGMGESDKTKAKQWNVPLYPSITEACQATNAELVDICVPTFLHKQLVLESISCGKHTLCEKPLALHFSDAQEMYDAAERKGVQLYVAQVLQFTKEVEVLHQVVADQRYGKPLDACFERLSACPKWSQGSWLLSKEKSGLVPYDLHIHDLDVIISLFGKPTVMRYTSCGTREYQEQYRFTYGYDSLNVSAEAAWFNACVPFTARWRVYFEKGMLICDGAGLHGYDEKGEIISFDIEDDVKIATGINLPPTGMFLRELTHFVHCAKEGLPSVKVPQAQVLAVLETLERLSLQ